MEKGNDPYDSLSQEQDDKASRETLSRGQVDYISKEKDGAAAMPANFRKNNRPTHMDKADKIPISGANSDQDKDGGGVSLTPSSSVTHMYSVMHPNGQNNGTNCTNIQNSSIEVLNEGPTSINSIEHPTTTTVDAHIITTQPTEAAKVQAIKVNNYKSLAAEDADLYQPRLPHTSYDDNQKSINHPLPLHVRENMRTENGTPESRWDTQHRRDSSQTTNTNNNQANVDVQMQTNQSVVSVNAQHNSPYETNATKIISSSSSMPSSSGYLPVISSVQPAGRNKIYPGQIHEGGSDEKEEPRNSVQRKSNEADRDALALNLDSATPLVTAHSSNAQAVRRIPLEPAVEEERTAVVREGKTRQSDEQSSPDSSYRSSNKDEAEGGEDISQKKLGEVSAKKLASSPRIDGKGRKHSVQARMNQSIAMTEKNQVKFVRNYLLMDEEDMQRAGIKGYRNKLGQILVSKAYDVSMIVLIVLYCILIAIYFVLEDTLFAQVHEEGTLHKETGSSTIEKGFFVGELVILGIFCLDIALHITAYGMIYLRDVWNIVDLVVIVLSIAAVLLDIFVDNETLSGFLKIRGVMRLVRIFILFRKLNAIRVKRDRRVKMRQRSVQGIDLRTPQERILEHLAGLRERVDPADKSIEDLNYCIKMIASNTLYEADFEIEADSGEKEADDGDAAASPEKKQSQSDVRAWHRQFQEASKKQVVKKVQNPILTMGATGRRRTSLMVPSLKGLKMLGIVNKAGAMEPEEFLKACNLTEDAKAELRKIEEYDFDIFKVRNATKGKELIIMVPYMLQRLQIFECESLDSMNFDKYMVFIRQISKGYKNITYHNKTHAADVAQTFFYFCTTCELMDKTNLDDVEMLAYITGAACHDYAHPGVNNDFLVQTRNQLAIRHNDQAVLENHHIASSFALMINEENNFMEDMEKDHYNNVRSTMIGAVLATDMSKHFREVPVFKSKLSQPDFKANEGAEKKFVNNMLFHVADISNPTKPWHICKYWTDLLFVEFFTQGDMERELKMPISQFMDRTTTNVAKTQTGFIDFVIKPTFQVSNQLLPKLSKNLENLEINKAKWVAQVEDYEERMKKGNKENDELALTSLTGVVDVTQKIDRPTVDILQRGDDVVSVKSDSESNLDVSKEGPINTSIQKPSFVANAQLDVIGEED